MITNNAATRVDAPADRSGLRSIGTIAGPAEGRSEVVTSPPTAARPPGAERAAGLVLVASAAESRRHALCAGLTRHGYDVERAASGREVLDSHADVDLILLDVDLTDMSGLEVCRTLRAVDDTPIIAISREDSELDCVLSLQAGADDHVVAQVSLYELTARMSAVMRRASVGPPAATTTIVCGPLEVDAHARRVLVHGEPVTVSKKEFDLLFLLASNYGGVVSRKEIMSEVWDNSWSRRTIDTHVSSLRSKLGCSALIETVRGVGFKINEAS